MTASVLAGPWRVREGVKTDIMPLHELRINGVAHIEVDPWVFRAGGPLDILLPGMKDGDYLDVEPAELLPVSRMLMFWISQMFGPVLSSGPRVRKLCYEENGPHYDIGVATKENYTDPNAITPEQRAGLVESAGIMATVAFPIPWQGGTVCQPWVCQPLTQETPVQPPPGYATVFYNQLTWHRGDRWAGGDRGLYFEGFRRPNA